MSRFVKRLKLDNSIRFYFDCSFEVDMQMCREPKSRCQTLHQIGKIAAAKLATLNLVPKVRLSF